jgi:hypothetical protein
MIKSFQLMGIGMIKNGKGGNKTKTGLLWETHTDVFSKYGITENRELFLNNDKIPLGIFNIPKSHFYMHLKNLHSNFQDLLSKKLYPDEAILNTHNKTIYIIEKKYQQVAGSADEKLQTCHFKKKQYERLVARLGYKVEYYYLLNDWFRDKSYIDVLQYIEDCECRYFFNRIDQIYFDKMLSK